MNDITIRFLDAYAYLKKELKVHTPSGFAKLIGVSSSSITEICKKRTDAGIKPVMGLLNSFNEISAEWLLKGEGEMIRESSTSANETPADSYKERYDDLVIETMKLVKENNRLRELLGKKEYDVSQNPRLYNVAENDTPALDKPAKKLK